MYSINNKSAITAYIQKYLNIIGVSQKFIAPSAAYDDNTRLAIIDFQKENSLPVTGVVDKHTLEELYKTYTLTNRNNSFNKTVEFPITPGDMSDEIRSINNALSKLLIYYGHTHNIKRNSSFYSEETQSAVAILRRIYLLDEKDYIDEDLYYILFKDLKRINEAKDLYQVDE